MSERNRLEQLLRNGSITRREFLARAAALGIAGGIAPALLSEAAFAEAPKKGGRLRMGVTDANTSDSLDPAPSVTIMQANITHGQLMNNLVEIDHGGTPIPELAESWESTPDASQWTFELRKGVEFHNGKTLEAQDVIDTFNHHRGEDSKSGAKGLLESITDIKADGKNTVVFSLSGGSADFPFITSEFHMSIFPAGTKTAGQFDKGIGTGPYMLESYDPGVRALVKRNPNYWKAGRAHFDEVETLGIADTPARTNALRTGEIDLMNRCERKTVHLLKQTPGIEVDQTTGTQHYALAMHTGKPPFDNNDVRLALKYAIDRQAMLDTILRGTGVLGNDHPISRANRFHATDDEIPQRLYDPDRAKFHLEKAGYSMLEIPLDASDSAFVGAVDTGILYREHAARAGIDINVKRAARGRLLERHMAQVAVHDEFLGRPSDRGHDVLGRLRRWRSMERNALEARALQQAADRGPCVARRGEAPGGLRGDAAYCPQRGGRGGAGLRRRPDGPHHPAQARSDRLQHPDGWPAGPGALVVRLRQDEGSASPA